MHFFGLTGGIASGKSTVAARFRERGVPVVDADEIARDVVLPGSDGLAAIVGRFGERVLRDGALDRRALGAIVFANDAERRALNAILHPRIRARTFERAAELDRGGAKLACYDAALIVENGVAEAFRPLVVVGASASIQIARIRARDGASEAEARARVDSQMPLDAKIALADFVLDNTGTLAMLVEKADAVLDRICERVNVDPALFPRPNAG